MLLDLCVWPLICLFPCFLLRLGRNFTCGPPVILVHGDCGSATHWEPGLWTFCPSGNPSTFRYQANKHTSIFVDLRDELGKALDRVLAQSGQERAFLIGHGMGGLVAAALAQSRPNQVEGVVTICSPWMGVPAMKYLDFNAVRYDEMMPGSPGLRSLCHGVSAGPRLLCISARWDAVLGQGDAQPPVPHQRAEVYAGHVSALYVPATWQAIWKFMRRF